MKQITKLLRDVVEYYVSTRQAGHTTLALQGLPEKNDRPVPLMVVHDVHMGTKVRLHLASRPVDVISLRQIVNGGLRGRNQPLIFDNAALMTLCQDAADEIDRLTAQLTNASRNQPFQ